jgi:hypothetical protein
MLGHNGYAFIFLSLKSDGSVTIRLNKAKTQINIRPKLHAIEHNKNVSFKDLPPPLNITKVIRKFRAIPGLLSNFLCSKIGANRFSVSPYRQHKVAENAEI